MRDLGRLESEIVQEKTITESSDNPVLVKLALQQDRNGQGVYWTLKQITP